MMPTPRLKINISKIHTAILKCKHLISLFEQTGQLEELAVAKKLVEKLIASEDALKKKMEELLDEKHQDTIKKINKELVELVEIQQKRSEGDLSAFMLRFSNSIAQLGGEIKERITKLIALVDEKVAEKEKIQKLYEAKLSEVKADEERVKEDKNELCDYVEELIKESYRKEIGEDYPKDMTDFIDLFRTQLAPSWGTTKKEVTGYGVLSDVSTAVWGYYENLQHTPQVQATEVALLSSHQKKIYDSLTKLMHDFGHDSTVNPNGNMTVKILTQKTVALTKSNGKLEGSYSELNNLRLDLDKAIQTVEDYKNDLSEFNKLQQESKNQKTLQENPAHSIYNGP